MNELNEAERHVLDGALECLSRSGVDRQTARVILELTEKLKKSGE